MVDFERDIKACVQTLQSGGTILYPTDTVWGLGCDATNESAVDRIFDIKHRPKAKSLIILLADPRDIFQYVAAPPPDILDIIEDITVPTTIIYPGAIHLADNAVNEDGSIAIRVTTDPFCKALIKRLQRPIVSTSANISGVPTPRIYGEIDHVVKDAVDYIVQYRQDDTELRQPSRIARFSDRGSLEYIR